MVIQQEETEIKNEKQKIFFPNLNGLRFIAAFLVIIHHIEQLKSILNIENYWGRVRFINIIGKLGVVLFFVLSGFLITYLLLVEESSRKRINVKSFYVRRILRIWPLYFLIIFLAFFILPNIDMFTLPGYGKDVIYSDLLLKLTLYALFLSNLILPLVGIIPYVSHIWSIGTEEQYYLIWPVILNYFKNNRICLMVFIVAIYVIVNILLQHTHYFDTIPYNKVIIGFWSSFNIDCMAIGGIYAILLFKKHKYLILIQSNAVFYATLIFVTLLILCGIQIPYVHYEFYSVLFGIIILNFANNDKLKISLENRLLNYLGNISYGLYMYHPIGIVLAIVISISISCQTNWFIYPLSLMITVLLAGLSYKYFESFFLKFKDKFSIVSSGSQK